jgi:hypothetical protein
MIAMPFRASSHSKVRSLVAPETRERPDCQGRGEGNLDAPAAGCDRRIATNQMLEFPSTFVSTAIEPFSSKPVQSVSLHIPR